MNDFSLHQQDIRPSLGETLEGYHSLSYKVPHALAEFVDNSTANYFNYKHILKDLFGEDFKLQIRIKYNPYEGMHGSLEITDNAYGMDRESFYNALVISKKPKIKGGRNEYGMGLKTAASWFGRVWEVESQRPDSNQNFYSEVNIPVLLNSGNHFVDIKELNKSYTGVSTRIKISSLRRKITSKDFKTLNYELGSMYRRDIKNGDIEIFIDDEKCFYEEIEILDTCSLESNKNIDKKYWKKEFNDELFFEDQKLSISGFIALRDGGDERRKKYGLNAYDETGFALFRKNRIVMGGAKKNYKPKEIFGGTNSFVSLRLFGEVNLNDFPVTQAKNQFDWEFNGLEDAFVSKMKEICERENFISTANLHRENLGKKITVVEIKNLADNFVNQFPEEYKNEDVLMKIEKDSVKILENEGELGYEISNISINGDNYYLRVYFIADPIADLYSFSSTSIKDLKGSIDLKVIINTAFPLFSKLNIDEKFRDILHKIIVIMAMSEKISMTIGEPKNNYLLIPHKKIREEFNLILRKLTENSENDFFSK